MNDKTSPVPTAAESAAATRALHEHHEQKVIAATAAGVAEAHAPAASASGSPPPSGSADADGQARRVIKRYSNRKLYDTQDSRYVTLLQIAEMVRSGEEVQIIDNNSKEDLTEVTLAQIIYEEQKAHSRSVPLQTLKELIHQRTEKVLTELREGPIGRLLPGSRPDSGGSAGASEHADNAAHSVHAHAAGEHDGHGAPASNSARSLVETAKATIGTIDEWRQEVDERMKTMLPSFLPWVEMNNEIKRLTERVEVLERQLKSAKS